MDAVAVISASGKPLMPTNPVRARKLIKKGKAVIYDPINRTYRRRYPNDRILL